MTQELALRLIEALETACIALSVIAGSCLWIAIKTSWRK